MIDWIQALLNLGIDVPVGVDEVSILCPFHDDNSESWVPLFVDSFKLTSALQGTTNENKGELISLIDKVRTSGSAKSLDYIPLVMDRMDKILEEENFDKEFFLS